MKLSSYIKGLQAALDSEGDMDIIHSSDDEGNCYQSVNYCGSVMYAEDSSAYFIEVIDVEELEDYETYDKVYLIN